MGAIPPEKMGMTDSVVAVLGKVTVKPHEENPVRRNTDKIQRGGFVHVVLRGPNNEIKYEEYGKNLVTDHGDEMVSGRMYDDTVNIVTGMRLGTGVTAAGKNGAASFIGTYLTGSNELLDATATDATKGAGLGWRTTFVCTWIAGDITNAAISEVVLTDETALTDVQGVAANTVARFVFGATIDKQVGDSLEVTWQADFLGA